MIPVRPVLAAAFALAPCVAQMPEPDVSYLQFPAGFVRDAEVVDLDGDGRGDLVVAVARANGIGRVLSLHLRRADRPAFRNPPDRELRLVRDVVAYAIADVDPAPGNEIVLFSPTRAVAVRWETGSDEPRYTPLARIDFLWQPADPGYAFSWQSGVVDLDRDGLQDLVVPEPEGYRVLVQRRDERGAVRFVESGLHLPPRAVTERQRGEVRFRSQRDSLQISVATNDNAQRGFLLELDDELAAPRVADWNADGRLDIAALAGNRFALWVAGEGARFTAEPTHTFEVPERGIPLFDPSHYVQLLDLESDGRAEIAMVSGLAENDTISSVVEVFRQREDGSPFASPADKLLLQGFVHEPAFDDVDGDGIADLAIGSLRTDVIDTLRAGSSGTVDAQLNLFMGRPAAEGGRFRRPVAMVYSLTLPAASLRARGRILARFLRDVDGDGLKDLFLRGNGEDLMVLPTKPRGRGYETGDPIWQYKTPRNAGLIPVVRPDGLSLLVVEPEQIVHVDFR